MANLTTTAPQHLPELPLELLLDILEWLLVLGGKANHRSAAYLAQSCRLLRTSEAGRQARYLHAVASLSLSLPSRLPKKLAYETEVLDTSRWPPQVPLMVDQRPDNADGLRCASEGFLDVDGHFGLSSDRDTLLCFTRRPALTATTPLALSPTSCREGSVLQRSIPLPSRAWKLAPDSDGTRCAVLYEMTANLEKIDIWNLQSGLREGGFELDESGGLAEYNEIDFIALDGQYLSLERDGSAEVRHVSLDITEDSTFPVIWSFAVHERDGWVPAGTSLLSPHFVSVIVCAAGEINEGPQVLVHIYRLDSTSSQLLATFSMPKPSRGPVNHVIAGARIAPGEEGIVVFAVLGDIVSRPGPGSKALHTDKSSDSFYKVPTRRCNPRGPPVSRRG